MQYINDRDYEYIKNKYHDTNKPYDSFRRFIRHDEIFAEDTGMEYFAMKDAFIANDEKISHLSHHIRKATAFAFVLDNTRISCDSRDRFPAINALSRPLDYLQGKWKKELFGEILPEIGAKREALEKAGTVTIWPDFDHAVPLWDRIFTLGFKGLLDESEKAHKSKEWNEDEDAFFEGIRISYEAIIRLIYRLADLADRTEGSERMAKALRNIASNPPATFYEALLVDYFFFIICEHIDNMQTRSLCNFDREFYRFYKNDIANGVSEEEIRTDLAYFFIQFTAIDNYWNQPVYLGGCDENDVAITNELSYLFLDVYDKMEIFNPKIQLKISKTTPKDFVLKALDMIRRGHNSIVLVCDETIRKSLVNAGNSEDDARLCDIKGCYEYAIRGAYNIGMNYVNLLKPLEYALHEGKDGVSGVMGGLICPAPTEYKTFEEFFDEYKRQLINIINVTIEVNNGFEGYLEYINPSSVLSAVYPTCLERGKSATVGGAVQNNTNMMAGFIADAADSLAMIKKYVFDKKEISLQELVEILDKNFEGNELLRRKLYNDPDKFGNNRELPDCIAKEIRDTVVNNVMGRPNAEKRGGKWTCGFHVARMSYIQGRTTAASPNGRCFGEELSKNVSASMGQNRQGATAAILSATKLDATGFTSDAALDLGLLPSAVKGNDGLEAMYGLLTTFMNRNGHALHINVFDADTLRDAQAHPEKYQDLQIRVCGWNVLWNNINKVEQDGFIKQAEGLV
ncbi:MAG: hypothetical protein IJW79_06000 [Clostridia bacterium]|nr:hypothetical protein [Clostridia bacterium]